MITHGIRVDQDVPSRVCRVCSPRWRSHNGRPAPRPRRCPARRGKCGGHRGRHRESGRLQKCAHKRWREGSKPGDSIFEMTRYRTNLCGHTSWVSASPRPGKDTAEKYEEDTEIKAPRAHKKYTSWISASTSSVDRHVQGRTLLRSMWRTPRLRH